MQAIKFKQENLKNEETIKSTLKDPSIFITNDYYKEKQNNLAVNYICGSKEIKENCDLVIIVINRKINGIHQINYSLLV